VPPLGVYAVCMYSERVQILLSPEQRRRLEAEARARGSSVASLVREAIDERFGGVSDEDRRAALERIRARQADFVPPDALKELIDARFDDEYHER
jgi:predicted DNA-binding protein